MKKVINIILLVVLGVSLSGCEWFEHENSNKKKGVEIVSLATELLTYGAEGYIVLIDEIEEKDGEEQINGRLVSKKTVNYKGKSDVSIPIDIDVNNLRYGQNNYIKIIVDGKTISYGVGTGENLKSGKKCFSEDFKYNGKSYVMEGVFKLNPESDTLFIDFVCRDYDNVQYEIRDKNWAKQILTSSQIDEIVYGEDTTRFSTTYISLSWMSNALPRECYNIDGRIYTKNMRGEWVYLVNQYPPLGYGTVNKEKHMIACVTLKNKGRGKGNGFKDKYKVIPFKVDGSINNKVVRKNL